MTDAHLVVRGEYEIEPLAAFDNGEAAQVWADRWNLDHLDNSGTVVGEKAVVYGQIPLNPAGGR